MSRRRAGKKNHAPEDTLHTRFQLRWRGTQGCGATENVPPVRGALAYFRLQKSRRRAEKARLAGAHPARWHGDGHILGRFLCHLLLRKTRHTRRCYKPHRKAFADAGQDGGQAEKLRYPRGVPVHRRRPRQVRRFRAEGVRQIDLRRHQAPFRTLHRRRAPRRPPLPRTALPRLPRFHLFRPAGAPLCRS